MKRGIIKIEKNKVIFPSSEVWMSPWELSSLSDVTTRHILTKICHILKRGNIKEYEVYKYVHLEDGSSIDTYSLEIIIPIIFEIDTAPAYILRKWVVEKLSFKSEHLYVVMPTNMKPSC